jgi:hypothetical protein
MAIDIRCEWCGRHMTTVSQNKVMEYLQQNGEVCGSCNKKVEVLDAFFLKKQERFMQQFNRLLDKAKDEFSEEVKRLASVKQSDSD